MPKSEVAYVSIERLSVTRTQEGVQTGLPKEMGTHEWHMRIEVNGQVNGGPDTESRPAGSMRSARPFPPYLSQTAN